MWVKVSNGKFSNGRATVECKRSGWGIDYKIRSKRPWAIFIDGELLGTKTMSVRTFGSLSSAKKAAERELVK